MKTKHITSQRKRTNSKLSFLFTKVSYGTIEIALSEAENELLMYEYIHGPLLPKSKSAFVFKTAKNKIINEIKRRNRFLRLDDISYSDQVNYQLSEVNLLKEIENRNLQEKIFSILNNTQKKVITLKYFEGYTNKETANEMSLGLDNVKYHAKKALKKLKPLLISFRE
jgi:RNA polymerase sigma factor (sigma-70 family)